MRKLKPQLQRIDIEELFSNSSNRGMLSFLERPPEEAQARLRAKQRVNEADSQRLTPGGEVPPVGGLPPGGDLPPTDLPAIRPLDDAATLPFQFQPAAAPIIGGSEHLADIAEVDRGNLLPGVSHPLVKSPSGVTHPLVSFPSDNGSGLVIGKATRPEGKLPRGLLPQIQPEVPHLPLTFNKSTHPEGKLPPGLIIDGSVIGRRQKIRRATVAQDGHSSGEQLLYQSLWNAANTEMPETRLISVGYNGMSSLCKLDRSNCKKNIQSLVEKLSVEVAQTYESASSTGTTYRIFSYREILRRREAAGMIWVVRTSGVRFVNPEGNLPIPPLGDSRSGAGSDSRRASIGEIRTPPVGEIPTPLGKIGKLEEIASTAMVLGALSQYGIVDREAVTRLFQSCKKQSPDCTEEEIVYFIHEKGRLVKARESRIQNPIGFLIDSVPKCLTGETLRKYRLNGREAPAASQDIDQEDRALAWGREHETDLEDPHVPEEIKRVIRRCLGMA